MGQRAGQEARCDRPVAEKHVCRGAERDLRNTIPLEEGSRAGKLDPFEALLDLLPRQPQHYGAAMRANGQVLSTA